MKVLERLTAPLAPRILPALVVVVAGPAIIWITKGYAL